jgi:hypothetical protein
MPAAGPAMFHPDLTHELSGADGLGLSVFPRTVPDLEKDVEEEGAKL